jgi:glycosyltransferase involved in cell wall biosynthesis
MVSGRPVIAYARGGVLDTVQDGVSGLLFDRQNVDGLIAAVEAFERSGLAETGPEPLVARANEFSEARFRVRFEQLLAESRPEAMGWAQ